MSASCRVRVSVSRSTGETLCRRRRRGPPCAGTPDDAGGRRCAYCATAVPPGAVPAPLCRPRGPRVVTYVIAEPCVDVKDKACIDECPVDCIYEGERMLYIHPDECVDLSLIHISEPTRLGMISYAVFCLKKKKSPDLHTRACQLRKI